MKYLGRIEDSADATNKGYVVNGLAPKAPATSVPASATIDSSGLITYKNSSGTALFTVQLPIYDGGVSA